MGEQAGGADSPVSLPAGKPVATWVRTAKTVGALGRVVARAVATRPVRSRAAPPGDRGIGDPVIYRFCTLYALKVRLT